MVKIKDFTLASKNWGGRHVSPVLTLLPPIPWHQRVLVAYSPTPSADKTSLTFVLWCQRVASYFAEDLGGRSFGSLAPIPRRDTPSGALTQCLGVDDRTLGAYPATCTPRHLTSHLSHSYVYIYIYIYIYNQPLIAHIGLFAVCSR